MKKILSGRLMWLKVFILTLLTACSTGKIVKAYVGDVLPNEQIAVLTVPENISLISVNGQKIKTYLLSNLTVNYGLKAGENLIVFQYESVWGKAKTGKDERPSEKIISDSKQVLINAKPGARYQFSFVKPTNIRAARRGATGFAAKVLDQKGAVIAESMAFHTFNPVLESKNLSQLKLSAVPRVEDVSASDDASALDALKALWVSATTEQKKSFLVWAVQQ